MQPESLRQIDDLARHVGNTLRRADDPLPASLRLMLPRMIRHALRLSNVIEMHPGADKVMEWAEVRSDRTARRLLSQLREAGVLRTMSYAKGGAGRATRYVFDVTALFRWLVRLGCNPSKALREKLSRWDVRGAVQRVARPLATLTKTLTRCQGESPKGGQPSATGGEVRQAGETEAKPRPQSFTANRNASGQRGAGGLGPLRRKLLAPFGTTATCAAEMADRAAGAFAGEPRGPGDGGGTFPFALTPQEGPR